MDLNDLLAQGDDRNGRTVGDENLRLCALQVFKTGKISSKKYLKMRTQKVYIWEFSCLQEKMLIERISMTKKILAAYHRVMPTKKMYSRMSLNSYHA